MHLRMGTTRAAIVGRTSRSVSTNARTMSSLSRDGPGGPSYIHVFEFKDLVTLRYGYGREYHFDYVFRCLLFGFCLVGQDHAMSEHVVGNVLDVLRCDVTASVEKRLSSGGLS